MTDIFREAGVTIIHLGPSYNSLDDEAMMEFGGALLAEATHADPPRLVVDLSQTEYIGSSFLELLVRAWKRIKARDGALALCEARPFCLEVLEHTRLNRLWPAYSTREEAVAALSIHPNGGDGTRAKHQPD